ncbi:MAG: flagellar hook-basal body complex protein FliE [Eubacteriales bacterium]|nr:flagellar hook-basal body complex protein FliE [Eubacteriales bacterium]
MAVSGISSVLNVLNDRPANGISSEENNDKFADYLSQAIDLAEDTSDNSIAFNDALLLGELDNLHDATIAARKAELSLSLTVQVRNKLVDAYNEIMRMQV